MTNHKSPHSFFLYPLLLFFLLSVCDGVITHHSPVELHNLRLDRPVVFTEISCMLEDCVQVFLVLLSSFALLLHLLLLFKFLGDPKKNKTFLLTFLLHLEMGGWQELEFLKVSPKTEIVYSVRNMRMIERCMNTLLP